MGETDIERIFSWTPREFDALIMGAKHKQIDEHEFMARTAMANAYANNAKRAKQKSIFNAEKERKRLERGYRGNIGDLEKERIQRMRDALKGFTPNFTPKGGRMNDRTNASHRRGENHRI